MYQVHHVGLIIMPGRMVNRLFPAGLRPCVRSMCRGDPPPLPASSWFTVQGYRDRWKLFIGGAKSMYTLAKCRKHVPGFSLPSFKADVLRIYEDACSGIARGDRTLLRQVPPPLRLADSKAGDIFCACRYQSIGTEHGGSLHTFPSFVLGMGFMIQQRRRI